MYFKLKTQLSSGVDYFCFYIAVGISCLTIFLTSASDNKLCAAYELLSMGMFCIAGTKSAF